MKLQNLHTFSPEDWKKLESQFADFSLPTIEFVTENNGSLSESESIYTEAFVYYTQLIELRGAKIMQYADRIIYSFARKLWIQKLEKRNVNTDFVSHRRAFFEMEAAFQEIDSINKRSSKTAEKLAVIGEPARTLILEHIGKRKELALVASRLGFSDEERAYTRVAKSLRKLIKEADSKKFSASDSEFEELVRYVLDNENSQSISLTDEKKIGLTMISRTVAMVRSYVSRKERLQRLKEMQERIEPDTRAAIEKKSNDNQIESKRMKPIAIMAVTALVAITVSMITAFGLSGMMSHKDEKQVSNTMPIDTVATKLSKVNPPVLMQQTDVGVSAFAITSDGFFLTSAVVAGRKSVELSNGKTTITADIVFCDTTKGIVLLKHNLKKRQRLPYRFAPQDAELGQKIYTVGYPFDTYYYSEGLINTVNIAGWGRSELSNTSPGSPLISDHGQVYGIVTDAEAVDNKATILQISEVIHILKEWAEQERIQLDFTKRNGLYYNNVSEQVAKIKPHVFSVNYSL